MTPQEYGLLMTQAGAVYKALAESKAGFDGNNGTRSIWPKADVTRSAVLTLEPGTSPKCALAVGMNPSSPGGIATVYLVGVQLNADGSLTSLDPSGVVLPYVPPVVDATSSARNEYETIKRQVFEAKARFDFGFIGVAYQILFPDLLVRMKAAGVQYDMWFLDPFTGTPMGGGGK